MARRRRRPGAAYTPLVRAVSVFLALGVMLVTSSARTAMKAKTNLQDGMKWEGLYTTIGRRDRQLLSYDYESDSSNGSGDSSSSNCLSPRDTHVGYNNSCDYILSDCGDIAQLFDYLKLVLCNLSSVQWLGYIILILWLFYLISLLATTADNFFVPPLNLLSEKLHLSPSIAGITLLAIGNGAPDVFTAYAGLKQDQIYLVLGALIGASMFISTVVLGTIIIVVEVKSSDIDKIDFVRDVTAYIIVVAMVIGVAYDGHVRLYEAVSFLLFYIMYICAAVAISFLRVRYSEKKEKERALEGSEKDPLVQTHTAIQTMTPSCQRDIKKEIEETMSVEVAQCGPKLELLGLTWPSDSNMGAKMQFIMEWPLSLLRWISVPPCYYDGQWTTWHYGFAVVSPVPMVVVLTIASKGWAGFYQVKIGAVPVFPFLVLLGLCLSLLLFFILSRDRPPNWVLQIFLGVGAFVMSIAWLNIEANEVVALLNSLGLLLDIDTGILGLTVLAIGNSVGDWVADTAVARAGKPGMGIASCYGSPLLNDVLGLSIALIAKIGFDQHGGTYVFDIHNSSFLKVKMSWIFLGISLISSIIIIPIFRFSPPKSFGAALLYLYVVFMVFSVLNETGHLNIDFLK